MSGETEQNISGWTVDTLHELVNVRFDAMEKAVDAALAAAEKANDKADTATEKRFEGVNEFRDQLKDQAATFITRVEVDARDRGLNSKIDDLKESRSRSAGGVGALREGWSVLIGLILVAIAVYAALPR